MSPFPELFRTPCAGAVFPNLEGSPRVPVLDYAWTASPLEP